MQWTAGSGSSELLSAGARPLTRAVAKAPAKKPTPATPAARITKVAAKTTKRSAATAAPPRTNVASRKPAPAKTAPTEVLPAAIGDEAACYTDLTDAGVSFERIAQSSAAGVAWPIKLSGPIEGVRIYGGNKDAPTNYLDCQLALALVEWAPLLEAQGVVGIQHYSMYRHDATVGQSTKVSGHALGRAIDVAFFDLRDGRRLSVLDDWTHRARGAAPCEVESTSDAEKIMRDLVCEASERKLFQMVLTPHYNDAHKNHVHLEIGPVNDSAWIG